MMEWCVLGPVKGFIPVEDIGHPDPGGRRVADWKSWRKDGDCDFFDHRGGCAGLSACRDAADGLSGGHDCRCGLIKLVALRGDRGSSAVSTLIVLHYSDRTI